MIHCFYHSADLDGHCSGAIVKYRFPDAVMHPINYGDGFPWDEIKENDEVYMVDFCLQPFNQMIKLGENHKNMITWIDHHSSSLGEYRRYFSESSPAIYFVGPREITKAACELTWEYLFPDKPVPLAVKLLSLYDSWTFQGHELEDMVLPFQMRMRMEDLDPKDWHVSISDNAYQCEVQRKWTGLFYGTKQRMGAFERTIDELIDEGRLLLRYDQAQKDKYAKTYAFETVLSFPYGLNAPGGYDWQAPEHDDFKAIAVNLGHTNSKVFDSVWRRECPNCEGGKLLAPAPGCSECNGTGYLEPYDLMITFVRRTDKLWNVSLYSTKEDVDCGAIAKAFGGGGHKGAAGFQCKDLPFEY